MDFGNNQITDYFQFPCETLDGLEDLTITFWAVESIDGGEYSISVAVPGADNYILIKGPRNSGWHHYAWRRKSGELHSYTDTVQTDELLYTTSVDSPLDTSPGSCIIGQEQDSYLPPYDFDASQAFSGAIDEVKIWNRALTENEISALYALSS